MAVSRDCLACFCIVVGQFCWPSLHCESKSCPVELRVGRLEPWASLPREKAGRDAGKARDDVGLSESIIRNHLM